MKYKFEPASHIDDYLAAIKDRSEFIVVEKDGGYTVINYVVQMADTFPDPETASTPEERRNFILRRECRGIIFDTITGLVIAKRLHKFFNVNEKDETQVSKVDFTQPHVILEKLDGSMITPVWTSDGLRWGTKMGVTQVALPVEEFVAANPVYTLFAQWAVSEGLTPIFEWCSRKQTIVLDYPVDQLVLTAIRNNVTGEYMSHTDMIDEVAELGIPVVKAYAGTVANMQALIDETRGMLGVEGFVVRFDSGHMIKVKAEDYCRKHSAKDMIGREKNIVELIVTEKIDDVKAFLDEKDLARVNEFERKFWDGVKQLAASLLLLRAQATMMGLDGDRKTYATQYVQTLKPECHRFMYKMFEEVDVVTMIKNTIAAATGTQQRIDEVRWMFNCNWNEAIEE